MVSELPASVRIANHYSPQMFGIGVKEIGSGLRPLPPAPRVHEEANPYEEQDLVVPKLPLEHFDDPEFESCCLDFVKWYLDALAET